MVEISLDHRPGDAGLIGRIAGHDAWLEAEFFRIYQTLLFLDVPGIGETIEETTAHIVAWEAGLSRYTHMRSRQEKGVAIRDLARTHIASAGLRSDITSALVGAKKLATRRGVVIHNVLVGREGDPIWSNPLATYLDQPYVAVPADELPRLRDDYAAFNWRLSELHLVLLGYAGRHADEVGYRPEREAALVHFGYVRIFT